MGKKGAKKQFEAVEKVAEKLEKLGNIVDSEVKEENEIDLSDEEVKNQFDKHCK